MSAYCFFPKGLNDKKASIGLGNGLALDRPKTITWTNTNPVSHLHRPNKGEWMIKFNGLSEDSRQRGPYGPYKPSNHSLYIRIIIFPHIDNMQSTGHN